MCGSLNQAYHVQKGRGSMKKIYMLLGFIFIFSVGLVNAELMIQNQPLTNIETFFHSLETKLVKSQFETQAQYDERLQSYFGDGIVLYFETMDNSMRYYDAESGIYQFYAGSFYGEYGPTYCDTIYPPITLPDFYYSYDYKVVITEYDDNFNLFTSPNPDSEYDFDVWRLFSVNFEPSEALSLKDYLDVRIGIKITYKPNEILCNNSHYTGYPYYTHYDDNYVFAELYSLTLYDTRSNKIYKQKLSTESTPKSVEDFVTRFYQQCLGRNPDTPGLNGWVNALLDGSLSGADVADGFIFSAEFINRYTTNEDFVTILYRAFFNRDPDGAGYSGWLNTMYDGTSRSDVLSGFIYSQEFEDLCDSYGIAPYSV
jgi:hypothetical protein